MTGIMGFTSQIPVHQVSGWPELWVTIGYGLSWLWVITVSTVMPCKNNLLKAGIENAEKGRYMKAQRQGEFCQLLHIRFPLTASLSLENKDNTSIPIDTALQHAVEEHEGG